MSRMRDSRALDGLAALGLDSDSDSDPGTYVPPASTLNQAKAISKADAIGTSTRCSLWRQARTAVAYTMPLTASAHNKTLASSAIKGRKLLHYPRSI